MIEILRELKNEGYKTKRADITIISGTAKGADKLGEEFADTYKLNCEKKPADWDRYGKSAGYRRNEEMAVFAKQDDEIGVLVAFWDSKSKGTKHMIDLANKHDLRVFVVNY